ncbi:hypothetical protein ACR78G_20225 [Sphingobacterium spiritivorum]|uniref:hypothetical protein n=1 Tax=Sphingobacterium spiritivorum TaxID=258 RepID=UPI003DA3794E
MLTTNDVVKVVDTILSIPGMNELVKVDLKISRKNALLLSHVIGAGLDSSPENDKTGLLAAIGDENKKELRTVAEECLQKAGLVELSEKLRLLGKEK